MHWTPVVDDGAEAHVDDTIILTIPTEPPFRGVASLVLGGVGTRLDLPFERVDDLQLAVLSMLEAATGEEVSVEIHADDERVSVSVGPLRTGTESDDGLALVLTRLTDGMDASARGDASWLTVYMARAAAGVRD